MTTYAPQPCVREICSINLHHPNCPASRAGLGGQLAIRTWPCQPAWEPVGCAEPAGPAQTAAALRFPAALGCQRQLPGDGSKWRGASQSLPAQRATGTVAPAPLHRLQMGRTGGSASHQSPFCLRSQAGAALRASRETSLGEERGDLQLSTGLPPPFGF